MSIRLFVGFGKDAKMLTFVNFISRTRNDVAKLKKYDKTVHSRVCNNVNKPQKNQSLHTHNRHFLANQGCSPVSWS